MTLRAVIFDLDETLLDRTGSLIDFARWQAERMLRLPADQVSPFVERFVELDANGTVWKDRVYTDLIAEFELKHWSMEELLATYVLTFGAFVKPKTGAIDAVHALKARGYKIGLISNGPSPFQERTFRALGIEHLLDSIVVSGAIGISKPDRRIFEHGLAELGVTPAEAIFFGDNPIADIEGAKALGMQAVYVAGRHGSTCDAADRVITTIDVGFLL